jgi:DNA-binding NarL/FixJ family response regulator
MTVTKVSNSAKETTMDYRIALVDDHAILRSSIRIIIEQDTNYKVCGEASNGNELLKLLEKTRIDLVILDLNMPSLNGMQTLDLLAKKHPYLAVMVLSSHKERSLLKKALTKGARGFLLKEDTHDTLIAAIASIRAGKRVISPELTTMMLDDYSSDNPENKTNDILTNREKIILNMVVNGFKTREIASQLNIPARTIESCRLRLREKINATTMSELIQYAKEHDLM